MPLQPSRTIENGCRTAVTMHNTNNSHQINNVILSESINKSVEYNNNNNTNDKKLKSDLINQVNIDFKSQNGLIIKNSLIQNDNHNNNNVYSEQSEINISNNDIEKKINLLNKSNEINEIKSAKMNIRPMLPIKEIHSIYSPEKISTKSKLSLPPVQPRVKKINKREILITKNKNGNEKTHATRALSPIPATNTYGNGNTRSFINNTQYPLKPVEASLKLPVNNKGYENSLYPRSISRESSYISRSPSPYSTLSTISSISSNTNGGSCSLRSTSVGSRRIFPQTYSDQNSINLSEYNCLEQSPVIFDANLSFLLDCRNQKVQQNFHPVPAHSDSETASNYLSAKIQDFLKRTDHVMEEWKTVGKNAKRDEDTISLIERQRNRDNFPMGRSKSVNNIMIKGYQIFKSQNLPPTSTRGTSVTYDLSSDDATIMDDLEVEDVYVFK